MNPIRYCETCGQNRTFNGPLCITCGTAAETHAHVAYRDETEIHSNTSHAAMQAKRRRGNTNARLSTRAH